MRLDVATAYFNVRGYSLIAEPLDNLHSLRLDGLVPSSALPSAEPEP
ncbi:MAG: hypothetical protein OXH67_09880 [Acidimicrobiaceae bacterium]|nr:hypothetical protein [Acidimicrobiaceae bacterium]